MLESCDWDLGEFVYIERENKYKNMRLPPKEVTRPRQYIYLKNNGFIIQKKINGKLRYFGYYRTLEEAMDKRDELVRKRWRI